MLSLRELRQAKGLTQKEVADRLGVDRTTYVKYETGGSEPNLETLVKLARLFETSLDGLFGLPPVPGSAGLDEREQLLLDRFRAQPPQVQDLVLRMLRTEPAEDR